MEGILYKNRHFNILCKEQKTTGTNMTKGENPMKKLLSLSMIFFLLCCSLPGNRILTRTSIKADGLAEIQIIVSEKIYLEKHYNVDIRVNNVSDLYGYSIDFIYDPKLVQLTGITGGEIFSSTADLSAEIKNQYVNESGSLAYCKILTGKVPGVNGSGTLMTLNFKAVGEGIFKFSMNQNPSERLTLPSSTMRVLLTDSTSKSIPYYSTNVYRNITKDTEPPKVTAAAPKNQEFDVPVTSEIVITYDESILPGDNFYSIALLDSNNKPMLINASIEGDTLKVVPSNDLQYLSSYKLIVPSGALKDEVNNSIDSDYEINFTTAAEPEDINKDGIVNIFDIAEVARSYGLKSTDKDWDASHDLNKDGIINLFDLIAIAKKFRIEQAVWIETE
jgi:hypothetical protein